MKGKVFLVGAGPGDPLRFYAEPAETPRARLPWRGRRSRTDPANRRISHQKNFRMPLKPLPSAGFRDHDRAIRIAGARSDVTWGLWISYF